MKFTRIIFLLLLTMSISVSGQNVKTHYKIGKSYLKKGNYSEAKIYFSNILKIDSLQVKALELRGQCSEYLQEYKWAADDYYHVFEINPKKIDYGLKAAQNLTLNGDIKASSECLSEVISLDKKNIDGYSLLSENLIVLKDYNRAYLICNNALKYEKENIFYYRKGIALFNLNRFDEAEMCFRKVLSEEVRNYQAMVWLAKTLTKTKKYNHALGLYLDAIRINPQYDQIYLERSYTYECMVNIPEAINDLSKYLLLNPTDVELRFKRADLYEDFNEISNAIAEYDEIIKLFPDSYRAYYSRAQCFQKLKSDENAVEDYQNVCTLHGVPEGIVADCKVQIKEINRESNGPEIEILSPELENKILVVNQSEVEIKVKVSDKSLLQSVFVNGKKIIVDETDEFIFSYYFDADVVKRIHIKAIDVYNNVGESEFPVYYAPTVNAKTKLGQPSLVSGFYTFKHLSDVDDDLPVCDKERKLCYALIIGNEDYSTYQKNLTGEINVQYALNDAHAFNAYAKDVFGIPERNIIFLTNATKAQMQQGISKFCLLMEKTKGKGSFMFYYAGHGMPDEKTKDPYLIPVDVSGTRVSEGVSLANIYEKFTAFETNRVLSFIDACFSGGSRDQGLISARGVKVIPKQPKLNGNLIVFSASSKNQASLPYHEQKHGIFTYYMLKKIKDTGGHLTLGELSSYIKETVDLESIMVNDREQTPYIGYSPKVASVWENWQLVNY